MMSNNSKKGAIKAIQCLVASVCLSLFVFGIWFADIWPTTTTTTVSAKKNPPSALGIKLQHTSSSYGHHSATSSDDNEAASSSSSSSSLRFHEVTYCELFPIPNATSADYQDTNCATRLLKDIVDATRHYHSWYYDTYNHTFLANNNNNSVVFPRRWLLFGDSTVGKLFHHSALYEQLVSSITRGGRKDDATTTTTTILVQRYVRLQCHHVQHEPCHLNEMYGLPPVVTPQQQEKKNTDTSSSSSSSSSLWIPPNFALAEGPIGIGMTNPNCHDCGGCNSEFTVCTPQTLTILDKLRSKLLPSPNQRSSGNYYFGGFFGVVFARDVEAQYPPWFNTTQDILQMYLNQRFQTSYYDNDNNNDDDPFMLLFGGPPICLVSSGLHDMAIPNVTLSRYLTNLEAYLGMLQQQCLHIVWIQNAAPLRANDTDFVSFNRSVPQTQIRVKEWNDAVYQFLLDKKINTTNANGKTTEPPKQPPKQPSPWHGSVTVLDVYEASRNRTLWERPLMDNVHMKEDWYSALGALFLHIMQVLDTLTIDE